MTPCWQDQAGTLSEKAVYILQNKQWCDCSFKVGIPDTDVEVIEAHRIFLAMNSPIFEAMLFGVNAETNFPVVINDIEPEIFRKLLDYSYKQEVTLETYDRAYHTCKAADKYLMTELVEICVDAIIDLISPETACSAYELALLIHKDRLKEECLRVISNKTTAVVSSTSFANAEMSTLEMILDMDELTIEDEMDLYQGLLRWGYYECERQSLSTDILNLRSIVTPFLSKVRFLAAQPYEIAKKLVPIPILSDPENLSIMVNNLLTSRHRIPLEKNKEIPVLTDSENLSIMVNTLFQPASREMPPNVSENRIPRRAPSKSLAPFCNLKKVISEENSQKIQILSFQVSKTIWIVGVKVSPFDDGRSRIICVELRDNKENILSTNNINNKLNENFETIAIPGNIKLKQRVIYSLRINYSEYYKTGHMVFASTNASFGLNKTSQVDVNWYLQSIIFCYDEPKEKNRRRIVFICEQ